MDKGDIVLVNFPFTDFTSSKYRPDLVLGSVDRDVTVCFITTQVVHQSPVDFLINASENNGLKKASLIKVNKIATLDKILIKGLLGKIDKTGLNKLNIGLASFLGLRIIL